MTASSITQHDLARGLGLSQMTVSRALRGHPHVDGDVRARVLAAAQASGYSIEANHAAEVLRRRAHGEPSANHVLCAMLHIPRGANDDESFQGRILSGMCESVQGKGVEIVLPFCCRHEIPLVVARRQVDGVVALLGQQQADGDPLALPVPWVSVFFDVKGVDTVTIDNQAGARSVGEHLVAMGHRKVAYIGPSSTLSGLRLCGLREALAHAGVTLDDCHAMMQSESGNEAATIKLVDALLEQTAFALKRRPFTALVAYNDYMAVAAMRHLRSLGIRVPEDLSLAGFDGAVPRGFRGTAVTTAALPLERMGAEAVRLLERRIQKPSARPRRLVLATEFRAGETTARLPR